MAIYIRRYSSSANPFGTDLPTSAGAPAITGVAGSLISVLDYCLTDSTYGIGWTKAYSGTNKAVYRQPTSGANGFYLAVDDSVGQNATINGFESMSSVTAGTGQFPTVAQRAALQSGWGLSIYKSNSATSTARSWQFFSNGKIFYLVTFPADSSGSQLSIFGDYVSYRSGDQFNTVVCGSTSTGATTSSTCMTTVQSWNSVGGTHFGPRSYSQAGTSVNLSAIPSAAGMMVSPYGGSGEAYPSPITGNLNMCPIYVAEYTVGIRGILPGLWAPIHTRPFAVGDTFTGNGDVAGKTFEVTSSGSNSYAQFFIETSDTWVTS